MSDSSGEGKLDRIVEHQAVQTSSPAKKKAKRRKVNNDVMLLKFVAQEHILERNVVQNFEPVVDEPVPHVLEAFVCL